MKCNHWVIPHKRGKKARRLELRHFDRTTGNYVEKAPPDDAERCGGRIVCKVGVQYDDPYEPVGEISIFYICNRCDGPQFSNDINKLPNEYNINEWITERI